MKKKLFLAGMAALMCAIGLVIIGCDDGKSDGGGDTDPKQMSKLSASASYYQALAKVNELIAATDNAGPESALYGTNMQAKLFLDLLTYPSYGYKENWGNAASDEVIREINLLVDWYNQYK